MSRFSKPLIALALAIIPFFLFLGTTDTVTVNGEVVSDNRFNLGGLIMAVIGLGLVYNIVRPSAPKDAARKGLAVIAGLFCLLQIASSVDAIRIDPLGWVFPDRHLPALQYSALADNDRVFLSVKTPEAYRSFLTGRKGDMIDEARLHRAYADLCHGGRYRVDLDRAELIPDYFNAEERAEIDRRANRLTAQGPGECTITRSNRLMGQEVDSLNRSMDLYDRLEEEYLALIG